LNGNLERLKGLVVVGWNDIGNKEGREQDREMTGRCVEFEINSKARLKGRKVVRRRKS
jgi:hypothetical protein